MTTDQALQRAESLLQPIASRLTRPTADRLDATVPAGDLPRAVEALRQGRFGYLSAITGLDLSMESPKPAEAGPRDEGSGASGHHERGAWRGAGAPAIQTIEVLYHFCECAAVVTLRVRVPYEAARVPSICHLIPSATLFERELGEMFGVTVEGTPDPDHLLLPESWPAGVYPLRKSFTGKTTEV